MTDTDKLSELTKKRGVLKSKVTLFEKHLIAVRQSNDVDITEDPQNKRAIAVQLEQRIDRFTGILDQFDEVQNEKELISEVETSVEREEFESRYYTLLTSGKLILEELFKKNNNGSNEDDAQSQTSKSSSRSAKLDSVKLPEIKIPKFEGQYDHWLEFRDIFESLIHNNDTISDIQKYHYLRASLIGTAAQVIQSLEFSSDIYNTAWKVLCERFNNKRLLIQNHLKAIFNFENITTDTAPKLRNICDSVSKHLSSLEKLGEPTEKWDTLIIFIMADKLSIYTAREWERPRSKYETVTLDDFKTFLKERANVLETLEHNFDKRERKNENPRRETRGLLGVTNEEPSEGRRELGCFLCKGNHRLYSCSQFLTMSIKDRKLNAKKLDLCCNCLRRGRSTKECKWSGCKLCQGKHNTILYDSETQRSNSGQVDKVESEVETSNCNFSSSSGSILPTAQVYVVNNNGYYVKARVFLDCGSESNFITTLFCERLDLPMKATKLLITGISNKWSYANNKCDIRLLSLDKSYSFSLSCFAIEQITSELPRRAVDMKSLNIPSDVYLADPTYNVPSSIDILIGGNQFWLILGNRQRSLGPKKPILWETRLGWIVVGPMDFSYPSPNSKSVCNFGQTLEIGDQLRKFWEIEETDNSSSILSGEELICENHFRKNVRISEKDGRFIVAIPFKSSPERLGESRDIAVKRFVNLERKLSQNMELRKLYCQFMENYEKLGHMTEIKHENEAIEYYMPHHGVLRESSSTTKLRVFFDASSLTSTGISLNELQLTGAKIQPDLFDIILRFRTKSIVISSDIKMMYRQILINEQDRKFQKILWRGSPDKPLKTYQLNTVTYGTTAAPFLAVRCLKEVANEVRHEHPEVARVIENDMYMDDLLTGTNSVENVTKICKIISAYFLKRGFELRKWKSNNPSILKELDTSTDDNFIDFSMTDNTVTKTLGLLWLCQSDLLVCKIASPKVRKNITKRILLSDIATIFDPLGLISPCIIMAKVLLQKLWLEKLTWDQPVPNSLAQEWLSLYDELTELHELKISRQVKCKDSVKLTLHGFSDACEKSYGACLYLVSKNAKGHKESQLVCAKSKVAPLKSLTMPRLELSAAVVLAALITKFKETCDLSLENIYCWTDSTIVLGWLRTTSNTLKPFVSHRVADIQNSTKGCQWRHVPTDNNPADIVSRGSLPKNLISNKMWWNGPTWLIEEHSLWPDMITPPVDLPEVKHCMLSIEQNIDFPYERFSNLITLKRTVAFMYRFINITRKHGKEQKTWYLVLTEMNLAFEQIIIISQKQSFFEDYQWLTKKEPLPRKSRILCLSPFLDEKGIMRVGGRLRNSELSYATKHPILISHTHYLCKLLFEFEIEPQLLLARIRETYWPTSGRGFARKICHDCVICARFRNQQIEPIMGDLPAVRTKPALPFTAVGVDYAGPFDTKDRRGRGPKFLKSWICLFVCLVTRAMHLEFVTSLSTEEFLQALTRFINRRGRPTQIYSDNAGNFVKADKSLRVMFEFLNANSAEISESAANIGIRWHFIPPNSPHFGGIWEAGVKTIKHHLKRTLGNRALFIVDFQTLIIRIEAIANSRPISPLSNDPGDLTPLTPAHFLIGRAMHDIPESSFMETSDNRLDNFRQLSKLYQLFWERWSREYILELQRKTKWKSTSSSLNPGQLVLIRDSNLPPLKWKLGRVLEMIFGRDGVCRVALVKTSDGILKRAVVRLCPLPIAVESQDFQGRGHVDANQKCSATGQLEPKSEQEQTD